MRLAIQGHHALVEQGHQSSSSCHVVKKIFRKVPAPILS